MTRYSVQPRDRMFVKGYGNLPFARNMVKTISKNLNTKYSQKILDHAKQSTTDALKTALKRAIQKTAEVTDDLIGNKIAGKTTSVSKTLPQNNSVINEEEILRKIYISRRKTENYWWSKIYIVIQYNHGLSTSNELIRWYDKSTI